MNLPRFGAFFISKRRNTEAVSLLRNRNVCPRERFRACAPILAEYIPKWPRINIVNDYDSTTRWRDLMRFPRLKTTRLLLREVMQSDADDLYAILSDPEVTKYYGMEPLPSKEGAQREIDWYQKQYRTRSGIRWAIALHRNRQLIGTCGFQNWSAEHNRVEIGYELSRQFWGAGIMTEALTKMIQYGFTVCKFNRIQAVVDPRNNGSLAVLRKLGFVKEGLLAEYEYTAGGYDDLLMFALLRKNYRRNG